MTITVFNKDKQRLFSYKSVVISRINDYVCLQLDKYYLVTEVSHEIVESDDGKYCDSVEITVQPW